MLSDDIQNEHFLDIRKKHSFVECRNINVEIFKFHLVEALPREFVVNKSRINFLYSSPTSPSLSTSQSLDPSLLSAWIHSWASLGALILRALSKHYTALQASLSLDIPCHTHSEMWAWINEKKGTGEHQLIQAHHHHHHHKSAVTLGAIFAFCKSTIQSASLKWLINFTKIWKKGARNVFNFLLPPFPIRPRAILPKNYKRLCYRQRVRRFIRKSTMHVFLDTQKKGLPGHKFNRDRFLRAS